MERLRQFFKKNAGVLAVIIFFGGCFSIVYLHNHNKKKQPVIKESWTDYYTSKYFVSIYDQLKLANKRVDNYDLEVIANSIVYDVGITYEVYELPFASLDSLEMIAIHNSEVEIAVGGGDDTYTKTYEAYTESLKLNIDLTK